MSATNAAAPGPVATLAQGLRDLRDNAEGPDGVELELLTSLPPDTIAEALRGVELPTLAVTVALVDAWGGDVEGWALYWAQINEIALRTQPPAGDTASDMNDAGEASKAASERRAPDVAADHVAPTRPMRAVTAAAAAEPDRPADQAAAPAAAAKDPWRTSESASASSPSTDQPVEDKPSVRDAADRTPEDAKTKVVTKPTSAAAAAAAEAAPAGQDKPGQQAKSTKAAPAKPKAPRPASERKSHRGLMIVGAVVVVAGLGGFLAYSAVHHGDKKAEANATSPLTPTKSRPTTGHAPTPTASAASAASTAPTASSQPSTSAPTTAATTGTSYPPGYEIGSYTSVQLPSGYSLDFTTDPSHPTFGTGIGGDSLGLQATASPGSGVSLTDPSATATSSGSVSGHFLAGQTVVFDENESGTFERCLNDTRYQSDVDLSQLSEGAQFCVHTTGGRLVLVRVDRMPLSTDANPYAVLDVTIWQG